MSNAPKALEAFFFNKLVNSGLFGEPKEGLLDSLKERVLAATDEQCDRAAEIIIRERKSGAFPSFPVCQDALRRAENFRPQPSSHAGGNRGEAVNRRNYAERVAEYSKRGGKPVHLKKDAGLDLWCQWIGFYDRCGLSWHVQQMMHPDRREWTTPGEVPSHFDYTFSAADNLAYSRQWKDWMMQNEGQKA